MTRKDTILIAVVINAGLLAILFTTAMIYDTGKELEQTEFVTPVVESKNPLAEQDSNTLVAASTGDEVDNVLKYYTQPASQPIAIEPRTEVYTPEPIMVQSNAADDEDFAQDAGGVDQEQFVEVIVKKGDMLEKIARANRTTVGAIKHANGLQTERLAIGQVLKIPLKKNYPSSLAATTPTIAKKQVERQQEASSEAVYYIIKSGDNPWKIGKLYNVKYEDILRLNHLDEEKARNLKVGDRIRVK